MSWSITLSGPVDQVANELIDAGNLIDCAIDACNALDTEEVKVSIGGSSYSQTHTASAGGSFSVFGYNASTANISLASPAQPDPEPTPDEPAPAPSPVEGEPAEQPTEAAVA